MLYLIRHGETKWNYEEKIQGAADLPLNENGINEAFALKTLLKNIAFSKAYASDLQRAVKTAEILTENSPGIIIEKNLRERYFGKYEGMKYNDIIETLIKNFSINPNEFDIVLDWPDKKEVEPFDDLMNRSFPVIKSITEESIHDNIAVITHGNVITALLHKMLKMHKASPRWFKLANCTCFEILYENKRKLYRINSIISPYMVGNVLNGK